jgi:hypothetical protein
MDGVMHGHESTHFLHLLHHWLVSSYDCLECMYDCMASPTGVHGVSRDCGGQHGAGGDNVYLARPPNAVSHGQLQSQHGVGGVWEWTGYHKSDILQAVEHVIIAHW